MYCNTQSIPANLRPRPRELKEPHWVRYGEEIETALEGAYCEWFNITLGATFGTTPVDHKRAPRSEKKKLHTFTNTSRTTRSSPHPSYIGIFFSWGLEDRNSGAFGADPNPQSYIFVFYFVFMSYWSNYGPI